MDNTRMGFLNVVICGSLALVAAHDVAAFELVRSGGGAATVVLPERSCPALEYAAEELVAHVRKMTGVTMPVARDADKVKGRAVLLGLTRQSDAVVPGAAAATAALGTDGWRLVAKGNRLCVLGSSERGVLYGVYELLERFGGCGWYSAWHTVVPRRESFAVPADLDVAETPAIGIRDENWHGPLADPAFAARLRLNARTYSKEPADAKYGGAPHRFGGGLKSAHTHRLLLPSGVYFKAHPEYFAEVNGRRTDKFGQLCLTNPDVLAIVTSNVIAAIRSDPGAKYFGVSQNDFEGYCRCARCRAVNDEEDSPAGTNIRFVNAVAEAVEREYPDKVIETLAYLYTRKPPKTRARKNVMICLCSIACDFAKPLVAPNKYVHNARFVADMRAWQKKCDMLYVWDYVTSFGNYMAIFANENVLKPNIQFFRDHGAAGVFEQGCAPGLADLSDLKCWLIAKFLWNPEASYEGLVRQFTDGHYGAAAPFLREYLERRKSLAGYGTWRPWENVETARVSGAFLEDASELFRRALEAVKDDPERRRAVREAEMPIDYMRLMRAGLHDQATQENRELAVRFLADAERFGPVRYSERKEHEDKLFVLRRLADGLGMP